ncbi:MAG: hypothetical protein AB1492_06160 [Bacillota bacterium]
MSRWLAIILLCQCLLAAPASAQAQLTIDGQFADWVGRPFIADPPSDAHLFVDVLAWYFDTNAGEEFMYFMLEREAQMGGGRQRQAVIYTIYLDMNDNGRYDDAGDRFVRVYYQVPQAGNPTVTVYVYTATGQLVSSYAGPWGDPATAPHYGKRCEFWVSFTDLGHFPGNRFSMFLMSTHERDSTRMDRVPDSGSVQWAPVSTLGVSGLAGLFVIGLSLAFLRRRKP